MLELMTFSKEISLVYFSFMEDTYIFKVGSNSVVIDTEDLPRVQAFWWSVNSDGYVVGNIGKNKTGFSSTVCLHRLILSFPEYEIDHVNRNPLDNRKCNLRYANRSLNAVNSIRQRKLGPYRGVSTRKDRKTESHRAILTVNGKRMSLGYFKCPVLAAEAYDEAALRIYGQYAILNFPFNQY